MDTMTHDELLKLRSSLTSEKNSIESQLLLADQALASQSEAICGICDRSEYGIDGLPAGWGYLASRKHCILLCAHCIRRWEDRWVICKTTREIEI